MDEPDEDGYLAGYPTKHPLTTAAGEFAGGKHLPVDHRRRAGVMTQALRTPQSATGRASP